MLTMELTKEALKRMIKEELEGILGEEEDERGPGFKGLGKAVVGLPPVDKEQARIDALNAKADKDRDASERNWANKWARDDKKQKIKDEKQKIKVIMHKAQLKRYSSLSPDMKLGFKANQKAKKGEELTPEELTQKTKYLAASKSERKKALRVGYRHANKVLKQYLKDNPETAKFMKSRGWDGTMDGGPDGSGTRSLAEMIKEELDAVLAENEKEKGADGKACWDGYKYAGTEDGKDKCVKMEETETIDEETDKDRMACNKPRYIKKGEAGHGKKQKVVKACVKGKENIVRFGDANMRNNSDKKSNRKNFRSRHNCDQKKDKTKAGYWSCKDW